MSSLDILEECLHRIYICRRNISMEKSRVSASKSGKRKHSKPIESLESPSSSIKAPNQTERNNLAEKNAKGMKLISRDNSKIYDSNYDINTDNDTTDNDTLNTYSTSNTTKVTAKSVSLNTSNVPIIVKNVIDLTLNDQTATVVFDEFRTELLAWWNDNNMINLSSYDFNKKNKKEEEGEDLRIEYSDYLTDKYLCLKLDPLKSSEIVSKVRKIMSKIIDDFAKGILPDDIDEIVFYKIAGNNGENYKTKNSSLVSNLNRKIQENKIDHKKLDSENSKNPLRQIVDKIDAPQIIGNNGEKIDKKTKQEAEKKTMKEQYAEYMRRSKGSKTKTIVKPTVEIDENVDENSSNNTEKTSKEDEYEVLNGDIRSLLSSIQNPISKSKTAPASSGKLK